MLRTTLAFASTLPVLASTAQAPDARFAPKSGLEVERRIERTFESRLDSWSARMGGERIPSEFLPKLELESSETLELVLVDEHLTARDGRPIKLRREFRSLGGSSASKVVLDGQTVHEGTRQGSSALESCVVLFDEDAKVPRTLEYGECDAALLGPLAIDLDWTAFLPRDASAASWKVAAREFHPFQRALGGIELQFEDLGQDEHVDRAQLERNVEGEWRVTRGAQREIDGRRVALFTLEGKFSSHCEVAGELRNVPVAQGKTNERSEELIELTGELEWDLERNVLAGLELDGTTRLEHSTKTLESNAGGAPVYEQDMLFTGDFSFAVRTGKP